MNFVNFLTKSQSRNYEQQFINDLQNNVDFFCWLCYNIYRNKKKGSKENEKKNSN